MLTVLAPCVLPLLPIIIGGSLAGDVRDKRRPLIITISLAVSLLLFTLLLKATTLLIDVPPEIFVYISGGILIVLGILTLFPSLYAKLIARLGIEQRAQSTLNKGFKDKRTLVGPIIIGAALGPVFSSCSPVYAYILATILPVNFSQAMVYMIAYIAGLSVVLLLIGFYGQRFISKIKFASNPKGMFQRILAILFIVVGLMIASGTDKKFQTWVSTHTPLDIDGISSLLLPVSREQTNGTVFNVEPYEAPELTGVSQWINSEPLTLKDLRGKVVLIDFWTYSCINCVRNNPNLAKLYENYKDQGLVVIGVHAPEFAFERDIKNVEKAVRDQNVPYPVVLDNNFATWNAYKNRSWPASYLIDSSGQVRRIHEGEGDYDKEEQAVRQLLAESGVDLKNSKMVSSTAGLPIRSDQTPETYLGTARASNFVNAKPLGAKPIETFVPAEKLDKNDWTLGGTWEIEEAKITARGNSVLRFHVAAKEVYLVMGSSTPSMVMVKIDGTPISQLGFGGKDAVDSAVRVNEYKLYRVVEYPAFRDDGIVELSVPDGTQLNAFTFGS